MEHTPTRGMWTALPGTCGTYVCRGTQRHTYGMRVIVIVARVCIINDSDNGTWTWKRFRLHSWNLNICNYYEGIKFCETKSLHYL